MDKEAKRKSNHDYYLAHREEIIARVGQRQKDKKEEISAYQCKWVAKKLRTDPNYRMRRSEWSRANYRRNKAKGLLKVHSGDMKERARSAVRNAIVKGILKRAPICDACDSRDMIQAHHPDYSKPLDVIWLCVFCHAVIHRALRQEVPS